MDFPFEPNNFFDVYRGATSLDRQEQGSSKYRNIEICYASADGTKQLVLNLHFDCSGSISELSSTLSVDKKLQKARITNFMRGFSRLVGLDDGLRDVQLLDLLTEGLRQQEDTRNPPVSRCEQVLKAHGYEAVTTVSDGTGAFDRFANIVIKMLQDEQATIQQRSLSFFAPAVPAPTSGGGDSSTLFYVKP